MKKKKPPTIVAIMILTVITIVFWIIFGVLRLIKTPTKINNVPEEILSPLTPTLDIETLRNLENRLYFLDSEIGEGNVINIDLLQTPNVEGEIEEEVEEEAEEEVIESTISGELQ